MARILMIDDNKRLRDALMGAIGSHHDYTIAETEEEAHKEVDQNGFDAIIVDGSLRGGGRGENVIKNMMTASTHKRTFFCSFGEEAVAEMREFPGLRGAYLKGTDEIEQLIADVKALVS